MNQPNQTDGCKVCATRASLDQGRCAIHADTAEDAARMRRQLASIKVLFRAPESLALYGIPYDMRPGQQPIDIWRTARSIHARGTAPAGYTDPRNEWIWLGSPGWWGHLSAGEIAAVEAWLVERTARGEVPGNPYEWCPITHRVGDVRIALLQLRARTRTALGPLDEYTAEAAARMARPDPEAYAEAERMRLIEGFPHRLSAAGHAWLKSHPSPARAAIRSALHAALDAHPMGLTLPLIADLAAQLGATTMEIIAVLSSDAAFEWCFETADGAPVAHAEAAEYLRAGDTAKLAGILVFWRLASSASSDQPNNPKEHHS